MASPRRVPHIALLFLIAGVQAAWWWPSLTGVKALYLRDLLLFLLPYKTEAGRAVSEGRFPALSDRLMGGMPLWAHPSAQIADPVTLLHAVIPDPLRAAAWDLFLHAVAMSILVYALSRLIGCGRVIAAWAAVAVSGCGPVLGGWFLTAVPPVGIPLAAAGGVLLARGRTLTGVVATGAGIAYLSLTPDPPFLVTGAALAAALCAARARPSRRTARLGLLLLAGAGGLMLAGVFLVPAFEIVSGSLRAEVSEWSAATSLGRRWIELFGPAALGVPGASGREVSLVEQVFPHGLYAGSLFVGGSVLLGLGCAAARCRGRTDLALAAAMAVLLLLAHGDAVPGAGRVWSMVHARFPEKMLLGCALCAVLLAARGWRAAVRSPARGIAGGFLALGALGAVGAAAGPPLAVRLVGGMEGAAPWLAQSRDLLVSRLSLGCWLVAIAAVLTGLFIPMLRRRFGWLLLALAVVEGTVAARALLLMAPAGAVRAAGASVTDLLRPDTRVAAGTPLRLEMPEPVVVAGPGYAPHTSTVARLGRLDPASGVLWGLSYPVAPDMGGFEPWRMRRLMVSDLPRLAGAGGEPVAGALGVLRAWGVEWIASPRPLADTGSPAPPVERIARHRTAGGRTVWLHRLDRPAPPLSVWGVWDGAGGPAEAIERLAAGVPPPVIEGAPSQGEPHGSPPPRILRESRTAGRVTATVEGDRGSLLVLTAPAGPGWTAAIDGGPVPIERANGLHIAVAVPPGRHDVVVTYRIPGLAAGAGVSLAGLVLLALLGFSPPWRGPDDGSRRTPASHRGRARSVPGARRGRGTGPRPEPGRGSARAAGGRTDRR